MVGLKFINFLVHLKANYIQLAFRCTQTLVIVFATEHRKTDDGFAITFYKIPIGLCDILFFLLPHPKGSYII